MYLNDKEKDKYLKFDVLGFSKQAKDHKLADNSVINAGIGMLYYDGKLVTYNAVRHVLDKFNYARLAYSTSRGNAKFQALTIKHFIREDILKDYYSAATITPGGTGALSMAFKKYLEGDIILPSLAWGNYQDIANEHDHGFRTYEMFRNGKLNVSGILDELKKEDKIFLLLNTPAHNPTGYNMKADELTYLFSEVAKLNKPSVLCLDIAYQDYANKDYQDALKAWPGLILVAASYSKSFGVYGLRIGSLICLSKDEKDIKDFEKSTAYYARTMWSSSNTLGEELVGRILGEENLNINYNKELNFFKEDLQSKNDLFKTLATEAGITFFPTDSGFFVTVKLNCEMEDLINDKIYLIPMAPKCYRISLSSITKEELTTLIAKLKKFK